MTPETFLQLSDLLPEPTLLVSAGGTVLAANRATRERLGLRPDAFPGRPLADAVTEPPDEVAKYLRGCSRTRQMAIGSLTVRAAEPLACRAEGAAVRPATADAEAIVLLRLVPKESAAGKFVALTQRIDELGREIHRRRAAEEAVRRQEEWLRVTLSSIGDGVIATDADGRVTFMNAVAEALTGWTQGEARGRPLPDVFHIVNEYTREPAENPAVRSLREGRIVGLANHTVLIARDGTERPIDDSAAPMRGDGTIGAVLVFRDVTERWRAERELARLAAIVASSDDAIVSKSLDGVIQTWNAGAERIFGYAAAEAVGKPITLLIPPERLDEERDILERLRRGERVEHFETVRAAKDGRRVDVSLTVSPIRDRDGRVIGASKVARDVTDRKRIEAAVRERDERLHLFLGNATDYAVIISDPDDRVVEWLGGAEEITGWRADEVAGRPVGLIFTPEDRAAGVPEWETGKAAEAGRAENARWHQRKDGTRFFGEGVTVGLRGPDGQPRGFGKVFRDATARKLAEERLTRDAMLLANVHDAVVMTDVDGVVTYWNEGATRLFGWTAGEMVGRPYADRFDEPARSWVADEIRKRLAGSEWSGEYEDARKDGSRVWIDARVTSVRDASGRVVGVLGLSHDVSERKRAEDALREADRKKDAFIALLAHELRNPLAPIRNGLQVLRLSADRAVRERSQEMMDRQLSHMVRMIDDLLDVSRINRNKMELRRARVTLAEVVGTAVETAGPAVEDGGHELTVSLPGAPVVLDADLTRLAQVFGNLLANSAKYTPRGGQIWLSAERRGGEVLVSVRDTGIGIPAGSLPAIFDMFSQVDRPIERATGGLGIGLALVKGLVEMHGGAVAAASEGEGKGSTFTVTLPVAEGRAEPAGEGPEGGWPGRAGRRVLVVDDNRDGAESMAEMLRLLGDEVSTAHDGVEAVEAAGRFRPEVILMDVGMPRLNGLDATRRIRGAAWGRGITIIALTGWGQAGDRDRSREAGCDGHLVKPVTLTTSRKTGPPVRAASFQAAAGWGPVNPDTGLYPTARVSSQSVARRTGRTAKNTSPNASATATGRPNRPAIPSNGSSVRSRASNSPLTAGSPAQTSRAARTAAALDPVPPRPRSTLRTQATQSSSIRGSSRRPVATRCSARNHRHSGRRKKLPGSHSAASGAITCLLARRAGPIRPSAGVLGRM